MGLSIPILKGVLASVLICFLPRLSLADAEESNEHFVHYKEEQGGVKKWRVIYQDAKGWRQLDFMALSQEMQILVSDSYLESEDVVQKILVEDDRFQRIKPFENTSGFQTEITSQALWRAKNSWSLEWELRYADWVQTNVDKNFFSRYEIATDCADVPIALRWIFSRIHSLPVANHLAGSGRIVSNESFRKEWAKLSTHQNWFEDKRFIAALKYVLDNTYTHSLLKDSYPIALHSQAVTAGSFLMELRRTSGHTKLISSTDYDRPDTLPFEILYSDVPQVVRPLIEGDYWVKEPIEEWQGGFRRFLWVKQGRHLKNKDMPFYSKEQYEVTLEPGEYFFERLLETLKPSYRYLFKLDRGIHYISEQIYNRIKVVEDGYAYCQKRGCRKGGRAYNNWSTPSRDRQIRDTMLAVEEFVNKYTESEPSLRDLWRYHSQHTTYPIRDQKIRLSELIKIFRNNSYNSDPTAHPNQRWALSDES